MAIKKVTLPNWNLNAIPQSLRSVKYATNYAMEPGDSENECLLQYLLPHSSIMPQTHW